MKPADITFLVSFAVGGGLVLVVLVVNEWLQERRFERDQRVTKEKASK